MERLTKWNEQTEGAELLSWDEEEWKDFMGSFDVPIATELSIAIDKLAEYEDLEEQGRLIVLPCKTGDTIYITGSRYRRGRIESWINTGKFRISDMEELGKHIFLTKAEAEKALEMEK